MLYATNVSGKKVSKILGVVNQVSNVEEVQKNQ